MDTFLKVRVCSEASLDLPSRLSWFMSPWPTCGRHSVARRSWAKRRASHEGAAGAGALVCRASPV